MTETSITTTAPEQGVTIPQSKYELVRNMCAKNCTDDEFELLIALANKYGLDPLAKQIWAVKYNPNETARIFAGRDGLLVIAHRSGQFDGFGEPEFIYDDKGEVTSVKATVYRKDITHPFVQYAWMKEDNLKQGVWLTRPNTMLLKVAEVRALKHAFAITGIYTPEEMQDDPQPNKIERKPTDIDTQPITYTCKTYEPEEIPKIRTNMVNEGLNTSILSAAKLPDGKYNKDMIDADYVRQIKEKRTAQQPKPPQTKAVCTICGKDALTPDERKLVETILDDPNAMPTLCKTCAQEYVRQHAKPDDPKPEPVISYPFCADCGDKRVLPDEEKRSREKYGIPLCDACYKKRLDAAIRKTAEDKTAVQNLITAAAQDTPKHTCSKCGAPVTENEAKAWNFLNKGKPLLCKKCQQPAKPAAETTPAQQTKLE